MDQNIDTEFQTLPDDVFEKLMGDAPPEGTPTAADAKGGTKPKDIKEKPSKVPKEEIAQETEKPAEKTQEELDKEIDAATSEGENKETTQETNEDEIANLFKAKALGLIERGIWQEFEGIEDFEWTEENYGKLAETQAEWKADEKYEEKVQRVGDVGKAILEYSENGGNPNEIIDLFKASRRVEEFDITTPTGKEETITEYYTKVIGWSDAKTKKYVKTLIDSSDDRLTEEATEAKELMERGIKDQIKQAQATQKEQQRIQAEQAKAWESNISKVIKERKDLTETEKKELQQAILVYNQKLPDGRTVNNFMVEFMKMQADPQKYLELVRFVTNPDKYKGKVEAEVKTDEAKKTWNLVKGNTSLSKATGTSHSKLQEKPKLDLVIDYKKLI